MPTLAPHRTGQYTTGFHARRDTLIAGRYRVLQECGAGNFARVLTATDTHNNNELVAVKILKREFARDATFELQVLQAIVKQDPEKKHKVCHMRSHFTWGDCPCFIFDLLGPCLKTRKFGVGNVSKAELSLLAHQLSSALRFLHFDCKLVHTDLKPENILLDETNPGPHGLGKGWSICDLGSASFFSSSPDHDLISTRPYRSPEVVCGCPWSYAADMWSIGCIIYEVARGHKLFDVDKDEAHIQMLERKVGTIPTWLVRNSSSRIRKTLFDHNERFIHSYPSASSRVTQQLTPEALGDADLADLLESCFAYDPAVRMRADELGHHPFVTKNVPEGTSPPRPLISKLPVSGYTSGAIKTPGTTYIADGSPLSESRKQQLKASHQAAAAYPPAAPHGSDPLHRCSSDGLLARRGLERGPLPPPPSHLVRKSSMPSRPMDVHSMYSTTSSVYGSSVSRMPPTRGHSSATSIHHRPGGPVSTSIGRHAGSVGTTSRLV